MKKRVPDAGAGVKAGHTVLKRRALGLLGGVPLAALLVTALCGGALAEEEGLEFANPHNFAKKELCEYCHKAVPPELVFDPVTTCTRCHPGNVGNHPVTRHPVGVTPRINIPKNLPLARDGVLVCYTCHDPHNRTNHRDMLRVDYFKLCASCHVGY